MKKFLFTCFFILSILNCFATHIAGGEMIYLYLGPGTTTGTSSYKITLKLFRDELTGGAGMPASVFIGIFINGTNVQYPGSNQPFNVGIINGPVGTPVPVDPPPPCMTNPPAISYNVGYYDLIIDLPDNLNGFTASYQTCCRSNPLINVFNPVTGQGEGSSYTCNIPGRNQLPVGSHNSSPEFATQLAPVCHGSPFTLNFSAVDPDGDSLVYSFCNAYDRGASINAGNVNPNPPPYQSVTYINGYLGTNPLGSLAILNTQTGIISGTAPPLSGKYVVCVCISEYRNGILISNHRKDFILNVSDCDIPTANPNPNFTTCDGLTVNFFHNSSGATTVFWDFGDGTTLADTSILDNPTYTYADTGTYVVTFVINPGQPCTDTAQRIIKVYPGFFPGFINSPTLCINQPIQFTDTTKTNYGVVDTWRWDFGDPSTLADTSHLQNPFYTYATSGSYTVTLIVTNSKGCVNTATSTVTISDPPVVDIFPADTIYCGLDSLQLTATGTGSFNWTPNTNIIGANTATPLVFPTIPTKYYAILTSAAGCVNKDSITITPKLDLTNSFTGPSPICEEDTVTLIGSSNYATNISWQWNPVATTESPTNSTTRVYPSVTTNYFLTTRWGSHCIATASKLITVKPLAIPNAGPSPAICSGQQSTQLNASGGNTYTWSPATGLSNPNIPNPVASPATTTIYTVSVGVTGCSKTRDDSLIVNVIASPPLTLINDTLICNIDTLQLTTTGTGNYNWRPNYMISNTNISSPLVSPDVPTKYFVTLTDGFGCHSDDSVFVDVKDHVTLFAGNDTTICRTDGFLLNTFSDALHYKWTPSTYLDYDTLKRPFTIPLTSTTYHVVANIGKCQSNDDIEIKVVPYPPANAGLDTALCPGFSVQLNASGGSSYLWTPVTFLNNRNIANPFATKPNASIRYIVAVTDTLGCPKAVKDTVWVFVYPKVIANAGPRDTSVVIGEPLLLNATGGAAYLWNPATWLNNPAIKNPVALAQDNIQYILTAFSNPGNCIGTDTIDVKVFKVDPDMYVPTAFTPNGDGDNDIFRPILLGMKELRYFRVYNRFGNLLYSTADIGKGWDGTYGGKGQDPATYVWMAEGVTYKGVTKFKKGYVVLIR